MRGEAGMRGRRTKLAVIALLVLLTLGMRLYYNSGPLFGNLQDEGIYLNIISQSVVFHSQPNFARFAGLNFSDYRQPEFNPANVFQFYVGFLYPEELLGYAFGFSTDVAVYYVIFTSLVGGVALFLVTDHVAGFRAATMASVIFAFMPLDVLFSSRVMPLVQTAALLSLAVFAFVKIETAKSEMGKLLYALLSGVLMGLAYLTHPEGVILLFFVFLYSVVLLAARFSRRLARRTALNLVLIATGFLLAYSAAGFYYLAASGNFLLYPLADHNVFLYQAATQPLSNVTVAHGLTLTYTTGTPESYLNLLFRAPFIATSLYLIYGMFYFSVIGYLFVAFAVILALAKGARYKWFFISMFFFYLAALSLMPTGMRFANGGIDLLVVNSADMYGEVLVLPAVVIVALGLDWLMARRRAVTTVLAAALIAAILIFSVIEMNGDAAFNRSSMSTVYSFLGFMRQHPGATFYGQPQFIGDAGMLTGQRDASNLRILPSCSPGFLGSLNDAYIVTGGTASMELSYGVMEDFDSCVKANLTDATLAFNAPNPFQPFLPLRIFYKN